MIDSGGGVTDLFYVLDLGDWFGSIFEKLLNQDIARAVGHLLSFGLNGGIWAAYVTVVAALIASQV